MPESIDLSEVFEDKKKFAWEVCGVRGAALARGRYAEAISCYSRALEADPSSPVLYSNRAMAHIKAESYGLAIADAEASIRLDASYIKAYYRRGSANFALGKYKLSLIHI